jgi:hypothetical protein
VSEPQHGPSRLTREPPTKAEVLGAFPSFAAAGTPSGPDGPADDADLGEKEHL